MDLLAHCFCKYHYTAGSQLTSCFSEHLESIHQLAPVSILHTEDSHLFYILFFHQGITLLLRPKVSPAPDFWQKNIIGYFELDKKYFPKRSDTTLQYVSSWFVFILSTADYILAIRNDTAWPDPSAAYPRFLLPRQKPRSNLLRWLTAQ